MKRVVIIGNSAAGISCAEALRKKDKEIKITILSREDYTGYNRCLISYYLAGDIKEDKLVYKPKKFYSENDIELLLNQKAGRIDSKKNQVVLEDKTRIDYDYLVLACGASPKLPEIKGIHKKGVFGFRTISDAKGMLELLPITQTACVLGGGLIGLKAAYGLKKRKIEVKVIVKSSQILSQILDKESAEMCKRRLVENGIEIVSGSQAQEIIGEGDCRAVKLDSGKVIAASIVVVGKGVKPNIELAEDSGIKFEEGVLVDDYMRTNIPNIYAAGDIAQSYDPILEKTAVNALWPNAIEQGLIVAASISGENKKYPGSVGMNSVEFFGLPVISFGITKTPDGFEEIALKDIRQDIYRKIVLKNNVIKGAVFVKKIENIGILLKLARLKVDVSGIKDKLLRPDFNFSFTKDLQYDKEEVYI
ncbi:MAG: FAD-dependent oxidoreductase [Candidatus Omnitrophota bacterium]|nr:FAD-dependent oxidoreductase [Candidatus Omnitrophota bacterium]